jgi:hypothetical protein
MYFRNGGSEIWAFTGEDTEMNMITIKGIKMFLNRMVWKYLGWYQRYSKLILSPADFADER